jgi:hypothetical protein
MAKDIANGFPLRRCSWAYAPVVSAASTRRMVRWLDAVCAAPVAARHAADRLKVTHVSRGGVHGA